MNFSELDIGDEFKGIGGIYNFIKISENLCFNIDLQELYNPQNDCSFNNGNIEVEKINTKSCEKCNYYQKETRHLLERCSKIDINLNEIDEKKFHCSNFLRKD